MYSVDTLRELPPTDALCAGHGPAMQGASMTVLEDAIRHGLVIMGAAGMAAGRAEASTALVDLSDIAWDDLPAELGCGCGKTCRQHLQLWQEGGVWHKLHALLLAELNGADQIDWSRAIIDASFAVTSAAFQAKRASYLRPAV